MVPNPVKKDEIMERFIVGTEESWPHATTALCTIVGTNEENKTVSVYKVIRNVPKSPSCEDGIHTEKLLIDYLETNNEVKSLNLIEVYQNYSPCRDCANEILEYIKETKKQGKPFKLTIIFANFYKTHVYPGNDKKSADDNIEGLQLLLKAGVDLRLLDGCTKWKEFLNMNQFIYLTKKEKKECLKKAVSDERKKREKKDRLFWDELSLATKLESISL